MKPLGKVKGLSTKVRGQHGWGRVTDGGSSQPQLLGDYSRSQNSQTWGCRGLARARRWEICQWGLRAWSAGYKGGGEERRAPREQALGLISEPASTLLALMPFCSSWAPSRPVGASLALPGSLLEAPSSPAVSPQVFAKASSGLCFLIQTEVCSNVRPRFGGLQNPLGVRKTGLCLRPAPISPVCDL